MSLSEILRDKSMRGDSLIVCVEATTAKRGLRKKLGQLERHIKFLVSALSVDPEIIKTFLVYGDEKFIDHPRKIKQGELDYLLFLEKGQRSGGAFEHYVYLFFERRFNGGTKQKVRYHGKIGDEYITGEIDVFLLTSERKWDNFLISYPDIQQTAFA